MAKDEKLDEMLEKCDDTVSITKNSDDSLEFKFKSGLVFENLAIPEASAPAEPQPLPVEENAPAPSADDEFELPDSFIIDEKYNTLPTPDIPTTIVRTYVPRFTGIKYRMKDDPRPRPKDEDTEPTEIKADTPKGDPVDPLAELEISHEDAVTVNVKGNEVRSDKTLSVFKFAESVSAAMGRKVERTVEDERREINELIAKKPEPAPAPQSEPQPEPAPAPQPEPQPEPKSARAEDYTIPDPTDDLRVIDYGKATREAPKRKIVEPDGASDEAPKPQKRKLGSIEFNTQAERDDIKDAFLDSTLSIKIRLVAMAAIAIILAVFENIIITPTSNGLGDLGIYPGLYGVIDLIFASAMFIIAIPEIARSIKYLTFGRIIPEISIIAAFLVEVLYTVIITVCEADNSPLYGLLFGIFAIATVASAHYRVNGDFIAFKVASRNIEKQVLDRKLTRTLYEENMALDGVIDEYKSRTARIFHAAFISDFFKRTSKVSENSLASLIPMIISFGIALIASVVSFFLAGGMVAAASGFALVFLLSLPTFSILVHKLPYYDAQMVALDENSTLIGETSYRSFSGVDVIAFDDTDIFGIEDVSLRRIILYGEEHDMAKTMKQMSALFAPVGGLLYYIFKKTHEHKYQPATDVSIEADGVSGMVDGVLVSAGTEEYMLRHNIAIPELTGKRDVGVDTTKVMYAAENGEIYAKFYIRYSFSEQFTMLLPAIKEEGIVPLIYTRDPNVSNELLRTLSAGSDSIRVMKKYSPISPEDNKIYRRISAELVTYGNNINTINTILLTKKYAKFAKQLSGTELYATVFTAAVSAILAILGVTTIPVIVFSLWQIAWCVVLRIASRRAFPRVVIDEDNS